MTKIWFPHECIGLTECDTKQILVYFCIDCMASDLNLKIIYNDYSKEHTKPLFNSHNILTIHNLYVYHTLLELYKTLKFRSPYCIFEIFHTSGARQMDLTIQVLPVKLQCQKVSFVYQSSILWNKFYKQLITPFTIPLHQEYILKHKLTNSVSIHYDYSTKVSTLKVKLIKILFETQAKGDGDSWITINHMSIC